MRKSIGFGLALLLAVAPAASAQGPIVSVPLAAGEVLLELNSTGRAVARADSAEVSVAIGVTGDDERAVRRDYEEIVARITAAARAAGAEIEVSDLIMYDGTDMMENAVDYELNATTAVAVGSTGSASADIRVRNLARLDPMLRSIEATGAQVSGTTYRVADDSGARRQARDNAIARARADADAYAASLNLRVARIVRVTERTGFDFMDMFAGAAGSNAMMQELATAGQDPDVETYSRIGVDFILAPR